MSERRRQGNDESGAEQNADAETETRGADAKKRQTPKQHQKTRENGRVRGKRE